LLFYNSLRQIKKDTNKERHINIVVVVRQVYVLFYWPSHLVWMPVVYVLMYIT